MLSHTVPGELLSEMEGIVRKLNEDILRRGARSSEEGASIQGYRAEGNMLVFSIATGRRVGPHEAALRIKNFLAPILGKKYRVGIREVSLEKAIIEIDGTFSVNVEIPIVESIDTHEGRTIITLRNITGRMLQKPILQRLIMLLEEKERRRAWGGKIEHWVKIKESARKDIHYREDPNVVLENIGWIRNIAPGQWVYAPPLTRIIRAFEEMLIDFVLKPLGFLEAIFPKMEPLDIALKTGHLKGTPNQMIFASLPISYNIEAFEPWQDYVSIFGEVDSKRLREFLEPPTYYMCFAQCPPFYQFLAKMIFTDRHLPVKWYDRSGPSFRWEGTGGLRGLERLVEFHRVEIVWLGTPEQVINIRNRLLERYEYFMDKVLDLEWRWAWVTPWFLVHAGEMQEVGEKIDINQPGTIDFEAYLPYKGSRDDQKSWLEIGNISIHGTKYTRAFRIRHASNKALWTGCSGFGVERWVLAFLAQKGFDPDNWPSEATRYIRSVPAGIEASNYPKPEYLSVKQSIEKKLSSC